MFTNKRAWQALKNALWWCVTLVLELWRLNPMRMIRQRHARLYYMDTDYNNLARPRWADVVCNIILPDTKRKAMLLKWVQEMTEGVAIDNFTDSWHDGIALCSLLEGVSPGSCPQLQNLKPEYSKSNCQLGIKIAQKYLSLHKIFISPDIMATASPETEKYILHLVQLIKWRHQSSRMSKPTNEESLTIHNAKVNVYEARGLGLTSATVGRRATFTIFTENNDLLDLNIEIRGPNNERNCEKITKISPNDVRTCRVSRYDKDPHLIQRDRDSSFHYMRDTEGNTVIRQRSLEDDSTNIIPFDYQFKDDQSFVVAYVPNSVGLYVIDIFSHGESIQGSPFEVTVTNRMSTWDKVTKKKLLMHSSRTYMEEVDLDEGMCKDVFAERRIAKLDQPRLLRQYTVTKRRVIKRMITRNGQEIVITDHNSSPGISRGSSIDIVDSDLSDTDGLRRHRNTGTHSLDDYNKAHFKANCLTARPFSPDNVSLCSFSRRSSGGMSDTSSSSGRHGDTIQIENNVETTKTTESVHTPDLDSYEIPVHDENKTALSCTSLQLDKNHVQNLHRFALQRALKGNSGQRQNEKNPYAKQSSEDCLPKDTHRPVDAEMTVDYTITENQTVPSNQTELTENNDKKLHDNDDKMHDKEHNLPAKSSPSSPTLLVDGSRTQVVLKDLLTPKLPVQCANNEATKRKDSLLVKQDDTCIVNEKRSAYASTYYMEQKRCKPKSNTDEWTQVSADEIKNETKWRRRVVRRRRKIPCSSEEDMARKRKELHLARAAKLTARQGFKETIPEIEKTVNSRQFGYNKKSEQPSCRIQRWLQSHHALPAKQMTMDSGISSEENGLSEHLKLYPSKVLRPVNLVLTNENNIRTNSAIANNGIQNDVRSSRTWGESLKSIHRKHSGTESSKSVSVSDSELQCAPSIVKQKRKLFAKTKYWRQETENMDPNAASRTSKKNHAPEVASSLLRRKPSCIHARTESLLKEPGDSSREYIENKNGTKTYVASDSKLMARKNGNLPCEYTDNKYQVLANGTSSLKQVPNDNLPEHMSLNKRNLMICTKNIPYTTQPSVLSTPEDGYDGFGLVAEKRNDFLNEIRAFQDLAVSDTVNINSQCDHNTAPTNPRRQNTVIHNILEPTGSKPEPYLGLECDRKSQSFLSQKQSNEFDKHSTHHWFGMSGQSTSVETDTSVSDVLSKRKGYVTDDDYWASSEVSEGCIASGFGLKYGYVGIQNNFQVWVEDPEVGNLMVGVRGPRPHCVTETSTTYTGDNLYEITYSVTMPGLYLIFIKWNNTPLNNSPFIVKIACVDDQHVDDD